MFNIPWRALKRRRRIEDAALRIQKKKTKMEKEKREKMGHSEHVPGRMQQQNLGFSKNKISTSHNRMEPDGEKITKSQMASQKRCFQILDLSSAIIVGEARGNEEDQRSSSAD